MAVNKIYRGEFEPVLPGPGNLPPGTDLIVYDEGLEWTPSAVGTTVNFFSTDQAHTGTRSAHVTGAILISYIIFQNNDLIAVKQSTELKLSIYLQSAIGAGTELFAALHLNSDAGSNNIPLTGYGFNESLTGVWQEITIPFSDFVVTESLFNQVRIRVQRGFPTPINFFLDDIRITSDPINIRIDIKEGGSNESESVTGDIVSAGSGSLELRLAPAAIPGSTFSERLAAWNEFFGFFSIGMTLNISNSEGSNGDYVITNIYSIFPPTEIGGTPGTFIIVVNTPVGSGDFSTHEVLFSNSTISEIIPLEMGGDPLHISVIDNNEDKFTPIRPKQATIQILTSDEIDVSDFCEAGDESFLVEIFVNEKIIFKGFLIIPDMQQEFMPHPNVLTLTAVDNLGTLKDQPLVDFNQDTPRNDNRLMDYIVWCLRKTGLNLPIKVINSVKHGTGSLTTNATFIVNEGVNDIITSTTNFFYPGQRIRVSGTVHNNGEFTVVGSIDLGFQLTIVEELVIEETDISNVLFEDISSEGIFYDKAYVDARTFEKEIGVCEDCSAVLTKIFKEDSVCFQQNGEWWIVRIDDIQGDGNYDVHKFDSQGIFIETVSINRSKRIGRPDLMQFMNDDAIVIPDRAYKSISETYRYNTPIEIICNIDFSQGDFIEDISPTPEESEEGAKFAKKFELKNWELKYGFPAFPIGNTSEAYIKRLYNIVNYESKRYAVIKSPSIYNGGTTYVQSCPLRVNKFDRFEASIDFKLSTKPSEGGGFYHLLVFVLHGSDGSWWILNYPESADNGDGVVGWFDTANWTANTGLGEYGLNFQIDIDYSKWTKQSYSFDIVPPLPIGGTLYTWLFALNTSIEDFDNVDIHYSNLNFSYYPFINGSYQKYSGQTHSVSQTLNNRAVRDEEVFISDSPALLFKGALKIFNGTDYSLASLFTDANHPAAVPFGELQAWAVWNQYRLANRNFDGSIDQNELQSVDQDVYDGADLLHKYRLTDGNKNTKDRLFMLLHYDMDFHLLEWKAFIASLYRTDIGKVYTDAHVFKYLSE